MFTGPSAYLEGGEITYRTFSPRKEKFKDFKTTWMGVRKHGLG